MTHSPVVAHRFRRVTPEGAAQVDAVELERDGAFGREIANNLCSALRRHAPEAVSDEAAAIGRIAAR